MILLGLVACGSESQPVPPYARTRSLEQATAAQFGGVSTARIVLWLKLWNALAFGLLIIAIDRVLRTDPARRARAHLLWSLNPLLLWGLVASGHVDTVAAGCGLLGLLLVKPWRRDEEPHLARFLAAGALTGAATDLKITYVLFGLGLAWAARRSAAALIAAGSGALAVLVPSYLWFGRQALTVLANHRDATTDNLYRLFVHSFPRPSLADVDLVIVPVVVLLAALLLWRLPDRLPDLPAVMPAFALSLAWMLAWPYQRPWYDAAVMCPLVLYPAPRLDRVILGQLAPGHRGAHARHAELPAPAQLAGHGAERAGQSHHAAGPAGRAAGRGGAVRDRGMVRAGPGTRSRQLARL